MKWGIPVNLLTKKVSQDYEAPHGEKIKITCSNTTSPLALFVSPDPNVFEKTMVDLMKFKFGLKSDCELLFCKVDFIKEGDHYRVNQEVHLLSKSPLAIQTAIAVIILALGVVVSSWLGVMTWGTYRFIKGTKGLGSGIGLILIFLLILVFLGGFLELGKGKLKLGKG